MENLRPEDFEEVEEVSIHEFESTMKLLSELKKRHDEVSKKEKQIKAELEAIQGKVQSLLEKTGKTKYVSDYGTAYVETKLAFRVPKSVEDKRAFFQWLQENEGQDVADHYMTVNSQALNSLLNTLTAEYAEKGKVLEVDGIEPPTSREVFKFRKA